MSSLTEQILTAPNRLAMPFLSSPGAKLIGATVQDIVKNPGLQFDAQVALHRRFKTSFVMTAMDLSVEAEEFGSQIRITGDEVPTVIGRLVTDEKGIAALTVPSVGGKRSQVYLEVARRLVQTLDHPPVLAGMIGPFSLAGRLYGVSEALLATATEPETMTRLVEKTTAFLIGYARAFKKVGVQGLIIAEPTAGLMSPGSVSEFSSPYIRRIITELQDVDFTIILHNCGARIAHLKATLASGAPIVHFGKPMDLGAVLKELPGDRIVCGNLDPAEVFCNSTPEEVKGRTSALLALARGHRNFVVSSGCDIPAQCSVANLDAFFSTVRST